MNNASPGLDSAVENCFKYGALYLKAYNGFTNPVK